MRGCSNEVKSDNYHNMSLLRIFKHKSNQNQANEVRIQYFKLQNFHHSVVKYHAGYVTEA